jgi:hypothetical protein
MKQLLVGAGAIFFVASGSAAAGELCDAATQAAPGLACAEAPLGVALSRDPLRAQSLAGLGRGGETRFRRHFGLDPARYAIVEFDDPALLGGHIRALNAGGFKRTLPWFAPTAYLAAISAAAVSQARAEGEAADLAPERIEALAAEAAARARAVFTPFEIADDEAGVVPHEVGHGWYTEAFWPGITLDTDGHYGGPGADWMDETAAVLVEGGDFPDNRRRDFLEIYHGEAADMRGYLLDLAGFLNREHPGKAAVAQDAAKAESNATGAPVVAVVPRGSGPEQDRFSAYYPMARVFADYLIERTGDTAVFGSIGDSFARGETFDRWLANEGTRRGLAGTVPELQDAWLTWLTMRFREPGPVSGS